MTIKVYTPKEVAEILQVTERTIYRYIDSGHLKAVKIGKHWRISEEAFKAFLEAGTETE